MSRVDWRLYERLAAAFIAEDQGIEMSITPNARIMGCISGRSRQVDVLVDARWDDDLSRRIIVDAKRHRERVDIKVVEAFEGMMRDCRAERGVIVCPSGWTVGARSRAQDAITITLLPLDELENEDWQATLGRCYGPCAGLPTDREGGVVLWDGQHCPGIGELWAIVSTGKCDVCHGFHVWCWGCGEKFALSLEDDRECSCGHAWLSLIEEEVEDRSGQTQNAVYLVLLPAEECPVPLDRRMLR